MEQRRQVHQFLCAIRFLENFKWDICSLDISVLYGQSDIKHHSIFVHQNIEELIGQIDGQEGILLL